jgi:anaerobic selenocysteine-containing dehydrogenase
MFSYIRLSEGGERRHVGPRSEVEIIADLAIRVLGETVSGSGGQVLNWREMSHTNTIRQAIARIVPGLEAMATIEQTKKEFSIPGRALASPKFPTADGKETLFVHDLPQAPTTLQLMTIRSEGQFNTVVYEEEDLYRNQTRRDLILIHPDDITRFCLTAGARCRIRSSVVEMRGVYVSAFPEIRPGSVAMYYPESNILVPKAADPLSRTPAYKSVSVTVEADTAGGRGMRPTPQLVAAGMPKDKLKQC